VLYRDDALNARIMTMQHSLDGRSLDIKPKDENIIAAKHGAAVAAPPYAGGGGTSAPPLSKTKIFVGRLLDDVEPEDLRQYFEQYGSVIDVFMPTVHATGKRKNVGFVEFSSAESCSQVPPHCLCAPQHAQAQTLSDAPCRSSLTHLDKSLIKPRMQAANNS
jgi:RNA-binding protein Musashi